MMLTCCHPECVAAERDRATYAATALCIEHWHGLARDLEVIARLWPALHACRDSWLTYRPKTTSGGRSKVIGSPAPGNVDVMSATDPNGSTFVAIHGWAADVIGTDRQLSPAEAARALSLHAQDLACHPALEEVIPELHAAAVTLAVILDEHFNTSDEDNRPQPVTRCTSPDPQDESRDCGGMMTWRPGTLAIVCRRCQRSDEVEGFLSVATVAGAFGLSRETIYGWVRAGHVTKIDRRVSVDDVRAMVRLSRTAKVAVAPRVPLA